MGFLNDPKCPGCQLEQIIHGTPIHLNEEGTSMRFVIEVKGVTDEDFDAIDFIHDVDEILNDAFLDYEISVKRMVG